MSKFTDLRDEFFSKIRTSGMREFSITDFKYYMKSHGFEKVCLYCGKKLSGRRRSYCCDLCRINFSTVFVFAHSWQVIRLEYLKEHPNCERCDEKAVRIVVVRRPDLGEGHQLRIGVVDENRVEDPGGEPER